MRVGSTRDGSFVPPKRVTLTRDWTTKIFGRLRVTTSVRRDLAGPRSEDQGEDTGRGRQKGIQSAGIQQTETYDKNSSRIRRRLVSRIISLNRISLSVTSAVVRVGLISSAHSIVVPLLSNVGELQHAGEARVRDPALASAAAATASSFA